MDPEDAHNLSKLAIKYGIGPKEKKLKANQYGLDPLISLHTNCLGYHFENPIGLAAGFDKDAECMKGIEKLGFGFMEVGSICPQPQPGNPKPRIFRLNSKVSDPDGTIFDTILNRCGFNSKGMEVSDENLTTYRNSYQSLNTFPIGVNLGKNKTSAPESIEDYLIGVRKLAKHADFLVINVSSPNTQHLRSLQEKSSLDTLIEEVSTELKKHKNIPLLIKIAPDLTLDQQRDIASLALKHSIGGIIVSNTTIERPFVSSEQINAIPNGSAGGMSGRPLFNQSTKVLKNMYKLTEGKVTLIGVGGVWDGYDALQKIQAGASLVQVYTAFTAQGPAVVGKIKRELAQLLAEGGYARVSDAVGSKAKFSKLEE
ncbi:predicted protein [Naegleria gruberi]|uniref:Dihydroorotate dehydrogenase (quinone), mitochondrial n=1 Tax=Naegleria gruberi TaxID=5762 RepID=D2UZD6_NAEGR|nr:uncharacterized protein NAEGRDRAFT_45450 [Naegleria gruberi]EFC49930.1 predicted protein [Naegleria gruberi]|eukprot:XP_002682674.1 predicted protein [Naegleria gruberi strain NEG-M]